MTMTADQIQAPKAPQAALATQNDDATRALNALASADNFVTAKRMAIDIAQSTLIPKAYQGNIPNVVIAMEIASRIGVSIFAAMQNLDVVNGRPSWRASFLIATVNASRRFTPLRFRWEGAVGSDGWGCRAVAKDRESGEECIGALITISLAKAEGWYDRNGSKWRTIPEQMVMYRAAAFWTRVYCPELSLGITTTEEAIDVEYSVRDEAPRPLAPSGSPSLDERIRAQPRAPAPQAATITADGEVVAGALARPPSAPLPPPSARKSDATDDEIARLREHIESAESQVTMTRALGLVRDAERARRITRAQAEYLRSEAARARPSADGELPMREPGEEG